MSPANGATRGLEGVVVGETRLSLVDGLAGRLIVRGHTIEELAQRATFEDVAHLLWLGRLPDPGEREALRAALAAGRRLPQAVRAVLASLPPEAEPLDVLRTALSAAGAAGIVAGAGADQAIRLTALVPPILAAFDRARRGLAPLEAPPHLGHAAAYLYLLNGAVPRPEPVRALDTYLVLLADHGMNASTFTARVVASTESDMTSAVVAALGALKGPLHGGAPSRVLEMLEAIGSPERAEAWLGAELERGARLMGFGHRVYRTNDPRAEILRELARQTAPAGFFALARAVEETGLRLLAARKPDRALYTNVEFYSAAVLHAAGLPGDLFTPTFAVSRMAGWTAHVLEQRADNRLIRPEVAYVGTR